MDELTRRRRLDGFRRLCSEHGLRCTVQRQVIFETVLDADDHPGADQVYERVVEKIPGVARTTVYRTLEKLDRLGLITRTCHPGAVARYDRRVDLHHHLVCLRCDTIIDIFDERLDALPLPDTANYGFAVSDHRVQVRGICRSCRSKE